mmetsp:Transcript_44713/g.48382  ORF Transcript_44713/g.48382 Transcript_44713/m.48382 type:complete len:84 (+) Transcript_44713:69-320(+)
MRMVVVPKSCSTHSIDGSEVKKRSENKEERASERTREVAREEGKRSKKERSHSTQQESKEQPRVGQFSSVGVVIHTHNITYNE